MLVPSVFQWERPAVIYDAPWQPTLLYPARGVALLWEADRPQPGAGARDARRAADDDRAGALARGTRERRLGPPWGAATGEQLTKLEQPHQPR